MAATVLATMDTGYYLVHTKLLLNIFVCFFAEKMNEKKKQTNKQINKRNQTKLKSKPNYQTQSKSTKFARKIEQYAYFAKRTCIEQMGKCGKLSITNKSKAFRSCLIANNARSLKRSTAKGDNE